MSEETADLRERIGDIDPSVATAAALWVGTDKTLDVVRDWAHSQAAWKGRVVNLLERCDTDIHGARFDGNTLIGVVPRDADSPAEGLRRMDEGSEIFVPDVGTEAGTEMVEEMSAINTEFQTLYQAIGGMVGAEHLSPGNEPIVVIGNGSHPVMYLVSDESETVRGRIMADPELWTPVAMREIEALVF